MHIHTCKCGKKPQKNIKLFIIKDFTFNIKINVMKKQRKIIMSNDIGAVRERTAWKGRWEKLYALSDFSYGFGSGTWDQIINNVLL